MCSLVCCYFSIYLHTSLFVVYTRILFFLYLLASLLYFEYVLAYLLFFEYVLAHLMSYEYFHTYDLFFRVYPHTYCPHTYCRFTQSDIRDSSSDPAMNAGRNMEVVEQGFHYVHQLTGIGSGGRKGGLCKAEGTIKIFTWTNTRVKWD